MTEATDPVPDTMARPGPVERAVDNAAASLRGLLPGTAVRSVHVGRADLFTPVVVALVLATLAGISAGVFAPDALLGEAGLLGLALLTVGLLAPHGAAPAAAIAVAWAWSFGAMIALLVAAIVPGSLAIALAAPALALLAAVARLGPVRGALAAAAIAVLTVGATVLAPAEPPAPLPPVDGEAVWQAQPRLLADQTEDLRPGAPGRTELFALLGAGYPSERVFRREVEAVRGILADLFDAEDRVLQLVNDQRDPMAYPALTRTTLTAALTALAAAMNPEDVLLLFLTSHGEPGALATATPGLTTSDLTPEDLSAALDAAGIGPAVIIVSACYSGSFVAALKRADRLVLTAAAADRTSFGCSDQNEWTYWGRAFFTAALPETGDLRAAAHRAREIVTAWEIEDEFTPSEPQIEEGAEIGRHLDALSRN